MALVKSGVSIPDLFSYPEDANIYDRSWLSRMDIPDDANPYDIQNILQSAMTQPQQQAYSQILARPQTAPPLGINAYSSFAQAPPPSAGTAMPFVPKPVVGQTPDAKYTGGVPQASGLPQGIVQTTSAPLTAAQGQTLGTAPDDNLLPFYGGATRDWFGAGYDPSATSYAFDSATVPQDEYPGGFRIRLRTPQGQYVFSKDHSFISHALQSGWTAVGDTGEPHKVTSFGGGYLIDGVPINAALTGEMTQEQADALRAAGLWSENAAGARITANGGMPAGHDAGGGRITTSGTTGTPGTGTGTGAGTGSIPGIDTNVPDNARDVYRQLLEALLKRTQGADALSQAGVDFFGRMGTLGDQAAGRRDAFIDGLYPGIKDTLEYFMANRDKAEGLSPEGRAALRQQLNEGIPERFNQAAQGLSTELLRRGADTGQMPGSTGDIVRGYAPLYAARAGEYSKANRDVVLEDERQKLASLLANRQLASSAIGQGTALTSTLGNIYNPSNYYNTGLGGLQAGISGFGAGTQGLGVGAGLAGGLADLEPTSFRNLLLASLLGSGSSALGDILSGAGGGAGGIGGLIGVLGKIFGGIFGGGNRPGVTPGPDEDI